MGYSKFLSLYISVYSAQLISMLLSSYSLSHIDVSESVDILISYQFHCIPLIIAFKLHICLYMLITSNSFFLQFDFYNITFLPAAKNSKYSKLLFNLRVSFSPRIYKIQIQARTYWTGSYQFRHNQHQDSYYSSFTKYRLSRILIRNASPAF